MACSSTPSNATPPTIASASSAAINAYSIAVTPSWSPRRQAIRLKPRPCSHVMQSYPGSLAARHPPRGGQAAGDPPGPTAVTQGVFSWPEM